MRYNSFVAAAAVAFSVAATAQTTPPSQTAPTGQNAPDEPVPGTMPPSQNVPAQSQTMPDAQTQSTQTTGETAGQASAHGLTAATAADVKAGLNVYDQQGQLVGTISSVSGKNAVVNTGKTRAQIPISSFAKGDKGLTIGMTKAQLEAAAKASSSPH